MWVDSPADNSTTRLLCGVGGTNNKTTQLSGNKKCGVQSSWPARGLAKSSAVINAVDTSGVGITHFLGKNNRDALMVRLSLIRQILGSCAIPSPNRLPPFRVMR
jgi:hypothetical protein